MNSSLSGILRGVASGMGILLAALLAACPLEVGGAEASGPPAAPVVNVGGSVAIPFKPNIPKEDIKNAMKQQTLGIITVNKDQLRKQIARAVMNSAMTAGKTLPQFLEGKTIDDLVASAAAQVQASQEDLRKQVADGVEGAATGMKSQFDRMTTPPTDSLVTKVVVTGVFSNDPDKKGWMSLNATNNGLIGFGAKTAFGVTVTADFAPLGLQLKVPMNLLVTFNGDVKFTAVMLSVANRQAPSTDASACPVHTLTVTSSVSGSTGLEGIANSTFVDITHYPAVHGTLEADKYK